MNWRVRSSGTYKHLVFGSHNPACLNLSIQLRSGLLKAPGVPSKRMKTKVFRSAILYMVDERTESRFL